MPITAATRQARIRRFTLLALLILSVIFLPLALSSPPSATAGQTQPSVPGQVPAGLSSTDWATIQALITNEAYLKASNTGAFDSLAYSVAISGDTVVVGAPYEDSNATGVDGDQNNNSATTAGAAYVFVRSGTTWSPQAYLKASNADAGDAFGISVAISGDTIVVGAYDEASTATGVNGDESDDTGYKVGAAYVFVRSGTTWSQQGYLKAFGSSDGEGDRFGNSVAISGDTVVVGALGAGTGGEVYVFVRSGTTWSPQDYFEASTVSPSNYFGRSVAISGDTVVVGADGEDSSSTGVDGDENATSDLNTGAAYVFVRSGTTWSRQAYLKASNTGESDYFGYSVAVSGDTVVVGAFGEDSSATGVDGDQNSNDANQSGAAYVFVRSGTTWSQQAYLKASNLSGRFGISVAVSGDTIVVGAHTEGSNATGVDGDQENGDAGKSGAAYIFGRSGTTWSQQAYLKASNTDALDEFGLSVAVSGDTVLVGAPYEDSTATNVGGDQQDNTNFDSGAAYVFAPRSVSYVSTPAVGSTITPGTVAVGGSGIIKLTISATSDPTFKITNLSLSGTHAAEFSITSTTSTSSSSFSIASGSPDQVITITCTPTAIGQRTATLTVTHNAVGSPAIYPLTCNGQAMVYLPLVVVR